MKERGVRRRRYRVAVIMGGQSAEREVSLSTGRQVAKALAGRHQVTPVEILAGGGWRIDAGPGEDGRSPGGGNRLAAGEDGLPILAAVAELLAGGIDVAFNALHGPLGEDGTIQGFCRLAGIPLTGPELIPAAVTMDKRLTKLALQAAGVRTPRFFSVRSRDLLGGAFDWRSLIAEKARELPFPWVLKPNRLGSSVGVAILADGEAVRREAPRLVRGWPESSRGDDLLVEEAIRGRELTCGVIETDGEPRALPAIEIRPRAAPFFDYGAKYTPGASEEICPAPLTPAERARVEATALRVHELFELAPLSRTDMFLTGDGHVEVLEVNTLPGMTETSLVPLALRRAGIEPADFFDSLLDHALRRAAGTSGAGDRAREACLAPGGGPASLALS
jgi:D-alanine-D-alanine ligase